MLCTSRGRKRLRQDGVRRKVLSSPCRGHSGGHQVTGVCLSLMSSSSKVWHQGHRTLCRDPMALALSFPAHLSLFYSLPTNMPWRQHGSPSKDSKGAGLMAEELQPSEKLLWTRSSSSTSL